MTSESTRGKSPALLEVENLSVAFDVRGRQLKAVRSVDFELGEGETLAIVGESGSGKSVMTKSLVGMLDKNGRVTGGSIRYRGNELAGAKRTIGWESGAKKSP